MTLTYSTALEEVKSRVNASRSSFFAGMAILPKQRREAMYALYAFCREVDDIADDGATLEARIDGLQQWRRRIASLFHGQPPEESITAALAPAIDCFGLVEKDFQDIIAGMEMDAAEPPICAPNMQTLDLYCDRVASAVGRASVRIFGDPGDTAMKVSHHLGRAFQLTNILRDLAEDAARGRLYLPEELLSRHGITSRNPAEVLNDPRLHLACRELADRTRNHFYEAGEAMDDCIPSAMRPARMMRAYYGAIFERLVTLDWKNPRQRVTLSPWQKLWLAGKNLIQ
ncbi:MAG: presqualene diphosphate synthase HpnD [Bdellovibrionales bacterium]